jgi:hypothetical protein
MATDKVTGPIYADDRATGGTNPTTARLTYEVSFTTNDDTAVDALNADDGTKAVPITGSVHPSNSSLTLKKKSALRVGNGQLFRVTCDYATTDTTSIGDKGTSPLSRPTRWSSSERSSTQEIDKDSNGNLLVTSANQTVNINIPYSDKGLVAVKNEAIPAGGYPPDYDAYFNRVNDDVYAGYAAKRLLLTGVSSQFTEELYDGETIQYYSSRFNFILLIKRTDGADEVDTWEQRILNEGTQIKDDATPAKPKSAKNEQDNTVISSPVKLNASGGILDTTSSPLFLNNDPANNAPTTTGKLDVYLAADFDLLVL